MTRAHASFDPVLALRPTDSVYDGDSDDDGGSTFQLNHTLAQIIGPNGSRIATMDAHKLISAFLEKPNANKYAHVSRRVCAMRQPPKPALRTARSAHAANEEEMQHNKQHNKHVFDQAEANALRAALKSIPAAPPCRALVCGAWADAVHAASFENGSRLAQRGALAALLAAVGGFAVRLDGPGWNKRERCAERAVAHATAGMPDTRAEDVVVFDVGIGGADGRCVPLHAARSARRFARDIPSESASSARDKAGPPHALALLQDDIANVLRRRASSAAVSADVQDVLTSVLVALSSSHVQAAPNRAAASLWTHVLQMVAKLDGRDEVSPLDVWLVLDWHVDILGLQDDDTSANALCLAFHGHRAVARVVGDPPWHALTTLVQQDASNILAHVRACEHAISTAALDAEDADAALLLKASDITKRTGPYLIPAEDDRALASELAEMLDVLAEVGTGWGSHPGHAAPMLRRHLWVTRRGFMASYERALAYANTMATEACRGNLRGSSSPMASAAAELRTAAVARWPSAREALAFEQLNAEQGGAQFFTGNELDAESFNSLAVGRFDDVGSLVGSYPRIFPWEAKSMQSHGDDDVEDDIDWETEMAKMRAIVLTSYAALPPLAPTDGSYAPLEPPEPLPVVAAVSAVYAAGPPPDPPQYDEEDARIRELEEEARRQRTEAAEAKARAIAEAKAREEQESRARAEAKAREEEEARQRAVAEAQSREEEEARQRAVAQAKAREEEEARLRAIAQAKAREEEEARLRAIAEERAREEQEARERAEAEARLVEEAQARAEAKAREEREARERAGASEREEQESTNLVSLRRQKLREAKMLRASRDDAPSFMDVVPSPAPLINAPADISLSKQERLRKLRNKQARTSANKSEV